MDVLANESQQTATLADVVDEVFTIVRATVPRRQVIATVRRCRRELDILHGSAHPDRVRGLALARLCGDSR
ncbi:MAG TPA: hypothetical protein VE442_26345 [Jatrophihabitans sp.]|jgi:hypothetical protein|nr:hypothetical protein [Jatrophihabitans sp.]